MRQVTVTLVAEHGNALALWPRVRNPLRLFWNASLMGLAKVVPFLGVKRLLYRLMGVRMGAGVAVSGNVTFDIFFPELIEVGETAIIGYGATILSHEFLRKELRVGRVRIGRDVLIGANATVLPGVTIGDGALISAMSLVHKDVGPGEFAAGVPIKSRRRGERNAEPTDEGG